MNTSIKFDKFMKTISDINMRVAILCLIILLVINLVEIVLRYTMSKSMIWIQEVSVLLMVWMIFTGTVKIVYNKKDIAITVLVDRLPRKTRMIVDTFVKVAILGFLACYGYFGYRLVLTQWNTRTLVADIRQIYYTIPVIIMSVCCTLMYINDIFTSIKNYKLENYKRGAET